MKGASRWPIVVAVIVAVWLLSQPFLHWWVRWQLAGWQEPARWPLCAAFVYLAWWSGRDRSALWCGAFAILAFTFNPIWPLVPWAEAEQARGIVGGLAAAIYAIRRWR